MIIQDKSSESQEIPTMLTKEQALACLLACVQPSTETETILTERALGRVLALPVISPHDVPGWNNSAMDGYAIRHADLIERNGCLPVSQRIPAGTVGEPLIPGTAARIFTGAPIPVGADTVVIQELCKLLIAHNAGQADEIQVPLDCKIGANIRLAGEDLRAKTEILAAGIRLTPMHLGLIAAAGIATVQVVKRLRVAIFTSGDELMMPGNYLNPGKIYNSNHFVLIGFLQGLNCEICDLGTVADDRLAIRNILERAAQTADLIIATGGMSVGETDYLRPVLTEIGTLDFWNIAIRPGKPVAFGRVRGTPFLGSPGNPVSLVVTFCLFARPVILRMQGVTGDVSPRKLRIRAGFDWKRPDQRCELQRARIQINATGELELIVHPNRSSAVLSSVVWADGLVEIPPEQVIQRGDWVDFLPFTDLLH